MKQLQCGKGLIAHINSLEPLALKMPTLEEWKDLMQKMQDDREEEYRRKSKMNKEAKQSINKICRVHNCTFEELPIKLQLILQHNLMGETFIAGRQFYEDFEKDHPEFAYLI